MSLLTCCHWGAFGLAASDFSVSIALTVCAGFWCPAVSVESLVTFAVVTWVLWWASDWLGWLGVNDKCDWCLSSDCWSSCVVFAWDTSLNWATSSMVADSSDESFWAWAMVQFDTLALVALALVCAAAFIISNSLQVLIVLASWNSVWTLNVLALLFFACVLGTAFINDMGDLAFISGALDSFITAFTLGGSDVVDGTASVNSAWLRWNSPAFTVNSFTTFNINADGGWCDWSDMGDWSMSDGLCNWCSCCCGCGWNSLDGATSSNWATGASVDNSSCVTWWAGFFTEMEALVLVAFAVVLVAAAVGIDSFALEVFIAFTSWDASWWTLWALWWWNKGTAWSSTAGINIVGSDLVFTFVACLNFTNLLRALDNTGGDAAT